MKKLWLMTLITSIVIFLYAGQAQAVTLLSEEFTDYTNLDMDKTTAHIDIINGWARLPDASLSSAITMLQDSPGYVVATEDGIQVYEYDDATGKPVYNSVFSVPSLTTATGVAVKQDNLNIWAVTPNSLTYYRYNGAGMSPSLNVTGLDNIISVAGCQVDDSAILLRKSVDNKAVISKYEDGNSTPTLIIAPDISDPIAVSIIGVSPDFRLFTKDSSYYFLYDDATGNYVQDPNLKISGLVDVTAGSSDTQGSIVLTKNELDYYINMDGGGTAQVNAFSPGTVSSGVSAALRPGYFDQVILDDNGNVLWWTYDDAADSMRRDLDMETSGFVLNDGYVAIAEYFSKEMVSERDYSLVRLSSELNMPDGTLLEWFISVDHGNSFIPVNLDEWTAIDPSTNFIIRCALSTNDSQATPYIFNVVLDLNSQPDAPELPEYGSCFITSTPELSWTFSDPDHPVPGDAQGAYQVQIARRSDLSPILDSGKIPGAQNSFTVPTSVAPNNPGLLWASGTNEFVYRVKVWDLADAESPWSDWGEFCVLAFERPRVSEIVSAPAGEPKPDPNDPGTHLVVLEGTEPEQLPKAKAGTKVGVLLDSIGPIDSATARFPYLDTEASLEPPVSVNINGINKRWLVEFWTDANLEACPTGTIVTMEYQGTGDSINIEFNMPPYAAGIIQTSGSVYEDWMVILKGRNM